MQAGEWMKLLRADEICGNFWSEISIEEQRDIISAYKLAARGYQSTDVFFRLLLN